LPYFKWNGSLKLEQSILIGRGKFSKVVKCKVRNFSCEAKDELCKRYKLKDDEAVSPPDEFAIKILDKSTIVAEDMAVQICQVQSKYF